MNEVFFHYNRYLHMIQRILLFFVIIEITNLVTELKKYR